MSNETRNVERVIFSMRLIFFEARKREKRPVTRPIQKVPPTEKIPGTISAPRAARGMLSRNLFKKPSFRISVFVSAGIRRGI